MRKATAKTTAKTKPVSRRSSLQSKKLPASPLAVAFRHIKPTWRHYLDFVEAAANQKDKEMQKIMATFNSLSYREQVTIMPEQLCDLADVQTKDLFAAVAGQLWEQSRMEATVITALNHPRVIEKTAKSALTNKGVKDREMFHKHTGFLPTPKPSPLVNIHHNPQTLVAGNQAVQLTSMEQDMLDLEEGEETLALPAPVDVDSTQEE